MTNVTIYDSTLRDGAQAEGISFSNEDRLKIVEILDELGVTYIEAGNPSSNMKELEFFKLASNLKLKNSQIVAFGSTRRCNVLPSEDANLASLIQANTKVVTIFGKSSDFHVKEILHTTLEENLNMIASSIKYLISEGKEVFFDAEHFFDGYKTNPEYALETLKVASESGASTIILCDTNGGTYASDVERICKIVKETIKTNIGIHAHNDCGMAVANSLMAVMVGVSQVQGTLIGLGERCGNANLSTIIGNLAGKMQYKCLENNNLQGLRDAATRIAEISNISIDKGMPFVGNSAFAHKAGMHIDGVLKSSNSFEHIDPTLVGNSRRFLLSEVAGKQTILNKLLKIDSTITKDSPYITKIVNKIKELEFLGYQFEGADASFELLALKEMGRYTPFFKLDEFKVIADNKDEYSSSALIKISVGEKTEITAAYGEGPVNALDNALRKALEVFFPVVREIKLIDYKVRILNTNSGTSAITRVLISSSDGSESWNTVGLSKDIIEASWLALIDSVEYKLYKSMKKDV